MHFYFIYSTYNVTVTPASRETVLHLYHANLVAFFFFFFKFLAEHVLLIAELYGQKFVFFFFLSVRGCLRLLSLLAEYRWLLIFSSVMFLRREPDVILVLSSFLKDYPIILPVFETLSYYHKVLVSISTIKLLWINFLIVSSWA